MAYEYLDGVEREISKLREFTPKIEANVIRGAVRAMASAMKKFIAPLVPRRTGALAGTLRVSSGMRQGTAKASVKIGNVKKGVFYAGMVMGGTKPHLIRGRQGSLAFAGIVRRSVQHPGAKPNPFMDAGNIAGRDASLQAGFDYADDRTRALVQEQGN